MSDFYIETADGEKVLVGIIKGKNSDGTYQLESTLEQIEKLHEIRPDLFPPKWFEEIDTIK